MVIQPTGRVVRDRRGLETIVERRTPASADDVWAWISTPARLKKWISGVTIVSRDAGERVELKGSDWSAVISIAALDSETIIYAKERVDTAWAAGDAGPRWEYALDRMLAAMHGHPAPHLEHYLAVQKPYYERLAMDGDPVSWPPS